MANERNYATKVYSTTTGNEFYVSGTIVKEPVFTEDNNIKRVEFAIEEHFKNSKGEQLSHLFNVVAKGNRAESVKNLHEKNQLFKMGKPVSIVGVLRANEKSNWADYIELNRFNFLLVELPENNSIKVKGCLTKEPELFNDGNLVRLSVAVNYGFGENRESEYFTIVGFRQFSENRENSYYKKLIKLKKADYIDIEGRYSVENYLKQDGTEGTSKRVVINKLNATIAGVHSDPNAVCDSTQTPTDSGLTIQGQVSTLSQQEPQNVANPVKTDEQVSNGLEQFSLDISDEDLPF